MLDLDIEAEAIPDAPTPSNFASVDPAILSYARPSTPGQVSVVSQIDAHYGLPPDVSQYAVSPVHSLNGAGVMGVAPPSATLTEPFDELSLKGYINDDKNSSDKAGNLVDNAGNQNWLPPLENGPRTAQKAKGRQRNRQKGAGSRVNKSHEESVEQSSRKQNNPKIAHLQEEVQLPHQTREFLVPDSKSGRTNRRSRRQKQSEFDDQNGWATEEATDIQDLGDFDFEENHKRFDKKKVFEEIRKDDTTAAEERLVSFNRLPARPGTYGGKNLHYTENVLDSPTRKIGPGSESESGADESTKDKSRLLRRGSSRISDRNVPSRKGSALISLDGQGTTPGILPDIREMQPQRPVYEAPLSANPSIQSDKSSAQQNKCSLRTGASDHPCRSVTPLQMLELEHLAMSEFDIAEGILIENAATAVAQTARKMASVTKSKPSRRKRGHNIPSTPLIVILAGNHRTGSRAIAAARQLRNHDANVLLCVLGLEREPHLLESVRRQISIFRKCGGRIVGQSQLMETLNSLHVSNGTQSGQHLTTDLIIDALLGMHLSFEDLRTEDQTAYSQLVQWANTCDVTTISIDVPSGVDASTGKIPDSSHLARLKAEASRSGVILQGDPALVVEAHHVLCLGAPKIGLLRGREHAANFLTQCSWLVADIGLDESVWKKLGLCARQGVEFGGEWVTKMELLISD